MSEPRTRRTALKVIAGAGVAGVLAGGARALGGEAAPAAGAGPRVLPWPYAPLDPAATAERAFAGYHKGHCAYGAFEALVGPATARLGGAYAEFPVDMWVYGAGGIQGWGTICGALNGAAAAFQLFSRQPEPLTDALYSWYEVTPLPDVTIKAAKFANVTSAAGSPLCHESVARWCKAAAKTSYSPERKERCGVITAAVARHAADLLNRQAAGQPFDAALAKATATCRGCHEKGGQVENARTKMGCSSCHFHLGGEHVKL